MQQDIFEKLQILGQGAKYDVACTSSGVDRKTTDRKIGSAESCGICHSFSADGRCISLLKVLQSNACIYDCRYCVSRKSADTKRVTFKPRELAELTIAFYRRNYIEGLFLSSAIVGSPDDTVSLMIETLRLLRLDYSFTGYIHAKAIPGASRELLERLGLLCDRMSVNIELPTKRSLQLLCPDKTATSVLNPMQFICERKSESDLERQKTKKAGSFVPAGQSTQLIVGATPETDFQILSLAERLYSRFDLKRVFFSAYLAVVDDAKLPALSTPPPLLREHRLYQADWLMRFYGFAAEELLDAQQAMLNPFLDPKSNWALSHFDQFPVEINKADYEQLLRVPGIGMRSARRIITARRQGPLWLMDLRKLGVVLKRARFFITCQGRLAAEHVTSPQKVLAALMSRNDLRRFRLSNQNDSGSRQLSFFDTPLPDAPTRVQALTGEL